MGFRAGLIAFLVGFLATSAGAQTVSQTRAQVPPGTTMLTNAAGNTNGTVLQVGGYASAMFSITASVAMSGGTIVNFECQANGTFGAVSALLIGTTTVVTTTSTVGDYQINVGSYQTCRTRISAYSAGTVSATGYPSVVAPSTLIITSSAGGGSAVTLASGAVSSGAYASGSIASGAVSSGAFASGAISDGADVTQGAKTDAKSTATDATSVTLMQVFKEISFVTQTPPQTFADSAAFTAASSRYTPVGGLYQSVITNMTDGQAGAFAVTSTRDLHIATYDGSGNAMAGQRVSTTSLPVTLPGTSNTLQSAATGTGVGTALTVTGYSSVVVTLNCATCSGTTVTFQASEDSSNFTSIFGVQIGTSTIAASTTTSGVTVWQFPVSGFVQFRANITVYSAGTITVTAHAQGVAYDPKVVNANLIAGTAVIGHVIADTGSTTAVTGNVTVVQPTGTNLHAVLDTTSTTAATQATASNFNAQVVGSIASAATDSGNPVKVGGKYNSSPITLTDGQRGDIQLDANGYAKVNVAAGSAANGAASNTGSAVPTQADYQGVNVGGTLRGQTAVNPSGTVYAAQTDLTSVAGTTLVTGTGAQGAGSPRVTVATDTATVAGSTVALLGAAATGAAVPANAVYPGAQDASGNLIGDVVCTASKIYDASTSGNTELVAISGSKHVYVCGYEMFSGGTVNLSLVAGTGTACASAASGATSTGTSGASAALTPAWQFTTQTGKVSAYPSHGWLLDAGSANALCLKTSAGVAAQVQVFYSQR